MGRQICDDGIEKTEVVLAKTIVDSIRIRLGYLFRTYYSFAKNADPSSGMALRVKNDDIDAKLF